MRIGLVGGRLVIALHHCAQVVPQGSYLIALYRGVQRVEEAQTAIQKQQKKRQPGRTPFTAQLHAQKAVAGKHQRHHQRAGEGHGGVQRHAEQKQRGGDGIRQVGIGHGCAQHQAVVQGELGAHNAGGHRQMEREIAVRALAYMIAAVRRQPDGMRILQIAAQNGQRNHHHRQMNQRAFFFFIKPFGFALVTKHKAERAQRRQRCRRQPVGQKIKPEGIRPQNRQPHHHEHAERYADIGALHRAHSRQKQAGDRHAARHEEHEIENTQQQGTSF